MIHRVFPGQDRQLQVKHEPDYPSQPTSQHHLKENQFKSHITLLLIMEKKKKIQQQQS